MVCRTLSIEKTLIGFAVLTLLMSAGCKSKIAGIDPAAYRSAEKQTAQAEPPESGSALEKEVLERFEKFYAVYSAEAIKAGIRTVYATDAWFGDPFHQVQGIDAIENYFIAMAEPVETCTFSIDSMQRSGNDYYARWTMVLKSKAIKGDPIEALGFSHVRFNQAGLIVFQQDYWDTSVLFDRIPVVGYWTRLVKGRIEKELNE